MLVYGNQEREIDTHGWLRRIDTAVSHARASPPGVARHSRLVGALVDVGMLVQGVADALFEGRGADGASLEVDSVVRQLMVVAEAVRRSWDEDGAGDVPPVDWSGMPALPRRLRLRDPEGFAHYALYPEAYLHAARRSGLGPDATVIGLRSIGTTLAAMVSVGTGAGAPCTLRPVGPPFRRHLMLDPDLAESIARARGGDFAIVDEGPGLSGSSIGATIALLVSQDIPPARIHVFAGHDGPPGYQASPEHRTLWSAVRRHSTCTDDVVLQRERLPLWATELLGPAVAPLHDFSGGSWRAPGFSADIEPPPAWPQQERRKFLWRTREATWLLKFAGLGALGESKLACARRLHDAGFTPVVAGLCHGFLAERWEEGARTLQRADRPPDMVTQLGRYLSFRHRCLPVAPEDGADPATLLAMAQHNTSEALGTATAAALDRWHPHLPELTRGLRRVWSDNRLHAWEWRVWPDGRLLKTDAVDHARAHDLIGCQDIAWDIAGASVELDLTDVEEDRLNQMLDRDPVIVFFHKLCYLAFQLGLFSLAASATSGAGRAKLAAVVHRRRDQLRTMLDS